MDKRILGKTAMPVTPVGMGTRAIGPLQLASSLVSGARLISYALEQGVNFIETCEDKITYGYVRRALEELGPSLAQGSIPRPVVAGKSLARDYEGTRRAIEDCRAALNIDQIDIFLLQDVAQPQDFGDRAAAWACLQDAKAKGVIRAAGISTRSAEAAIDAAKASELDALFAGVNHLNIKKGMASAICAAAENGAGVIATEVFGDGSAQDYIPALDYATGLSGVQSVVIDFGFKTDVDDAVAYFEGRLPKNYTPSVFQKRMFVDRAKCTGCGACVRYCTSAVFSRGDDGIEIDYESCVRCGFCLYVCPRDALMFL